MPSRPFELNVILVPFKTDRDVPERLGDKILNAEVLVADKPESRILAWTYKHKGPLSFLLGSMHVVGGIP